MPLTLKLVAPELVVNTTSNGGRVSFNPEREINPNVGGYGNFPKLTQAEQSSGVTRYRKIGCKVADATDPIVVRGKAYLNNVSSKSDSYNYLVKGTQRDTQSSIGSRKYGVGLLASAVNVSDTVLEVDFESGVGALGVIQAGDSIVVIDDDNENADLVCESVTWTGDTATITLETGVLNAFSAGARVASVIVDTDNVNTKFDNVVKSFTTSTYDETTYPLLLSNIGTIDETLTFTVINSTTFSVISDKRGALPNGTFSADYVSTNAEFAVPFFTLQAGGWGGSHTAGESMQVQIHPAVLWVWAVQVNDPNSSQGVDVSYLTFDIDG